MIKEVYEKNIDLQVARGYEENGGAARMIKAGALPRDFERG